MGVMTALGSWSLRCDLRSVSRASTRPSSTRLDHRGSSFFAPPAVGRSHRPPSRRLPATRLRAMAKGGGDRPSWTEAAAGMGRGRTKGEARVPKPPKRGKTPPSSDPDAAGRASRLAAATGARSSERDGADDFAPARGRRRGGGASRANARGGGGASRGGRSGRVVAESGGAAARAAAAEAPRSSAAVTSRNLDALAAAFTPAASDGADSSRAPGSRSARYLGSGFRLVRCMPHLRRREAGAAVSAGRVLVNGKLVKPSVRVRSGDVVTLDGKKMDWEPFAAAVESEIASDASSDASASDGSFEAAHSSAQRNAAFVYLKYHKPRGVTCTMEPSQRSSMLYALREELKLLRGVRRSPKMRVFPVGRLDRDSSGLVLLTDDGRVPEAMLDPKNKKAKTYDVDVDRRVSERALQRLRDGVVITTTQQRDGIKTTAPTQPCEVSRIAPTTGAHGVDALRFILKEGRNRQIRKMCEAVGAEVTSLHRVAVGDVELVRASENAPLECGGVRALAGDELAALARAVADSAARKRAARSPGAAKTRAPAPEGWGKRIREGGG